MLAHTRRLVALALAASLLTLSATPGRAAWPDDPSVNVPICRANGIQENAVATTDGAGGMIVAWEDQRSGFHIYAQRISKAGVPLWTTDGILVTSAAVGQYLPCITSDGAGGAIIAYADYRANNGFSDLYAQRIDANGNMLWTANGVAVSTAASSQDEPSITSDGSGGAIIAWMDYRSGTSDVYARRVTAAGSATWTANGVAVCTSANTQRNVQVVSDAAGGAYVAWEDFRSGTAYDIYAQRLNASGTAQGAANGISVCTAADAQYELDLDSDGQGGALLVWRDARSGVQNDIYAQRLLPTLAAGWSANGRVVSAVAGSNRFQPTVCSDGSGGAIVAYSQDLAGETDILAQRLTAGGAIAWTSTGVPVCTITGGQIQTQVAADGAGGAVMAWADARALIAYDVYAQRLSSAGSALWGSNGKAAIATAMDQTSPFVISDGDGGVLIGGLDARAGTAYDLYAQRIERYGQLGQPEPAITAVKDVKNDQGGFVKVSWSASPLDADPAFGIFEYRLWRSVPTALAARAALTRGVTDDADAAARDGSLLIASAASGYAWELAGSQTADALASYSLVTTTLSDSIPGSFPRTVFMVEARASSSIASDRWYSAPDSGYSVDNLAPLAPAPLTGQYAAGQTHLHWNPNTEPDLAGYRLHRGTSAVFIPSPATFVADLADTGYADAAGAPYVYKLFAVDTHGNLSPVATLVPTGTVAVQGGPMPRTFLALASANPSRGASTLRFGLAHAGFAQLALYDAAGRRVRTLLAGTFAPGEHAAQWDGRDDTGHEAAAGMYFARLEAGGEVHHSRIVRTR